MSRNLIITVVLVAAVVVAIALASAVVTREATINRSNYNRIVIGMHEAEVDEVFQQPPIDFAPLYMQDVAYNESRENLLTNYPGPHTLKSWRGDRYLISILLDKNGCVASKYYERVPDASLLDRIADWFGI